MVFSDRAHELALKAGARVKFCRMQQGFPKHTVAVVERCYNHSVAVRVLDTPLETAAGTAQERSVLLVPKVKFEWFTDDGEPRRRLQVPLVLAAAVTWATIQGVTLDKLILDCTLCPFAHGTLYTVLGRVKAKGDVSVLRSQQDLVIQNIVWAEFLGLATDTDDLSDSDLDDDNESCVAWDFAAPEVWGFAAPEVWDTAALNE